MTQTARVYGGSLYELAVEENLVETIGEQMEEIRRLFWENPDYMKLLWNCPFPGGKNFSGRSVLWYTGGKIFGEFY